MTVTTPADSQAKISITPIATIRTPFRQKFAIPRQPNLVPEAEGTVEFKPSYADPNLLRELQQFSHLWLLFWFHDSADQGWSPTVQPPRLGGKERVGTFASRSPFRPNPIGLSVVSNLGHSHKEGQLTLRVGGVDLLDGTPILDIKPYVPYADSVSEAQAGFAQQAPYQSLPVVFSEQAQQSCRQYAADHPNLKALITSLLQQDPRPAWRANPADDKQYGMHLFDLNIKWCIDEDQVLILMIDKAG